MATRILVLATKNENLEARWPQDFFLKVEPCSQSTHLSHSHPSQTSLSSQSFVVIPGIPVITSVPKCLCLCQRHPDTTAGEQDGITAPQECITDIRNWMIADRLKLNDDKTEFTIIGSRTQLDKVNVSEIVVGQAKVLAIMIVRNLSMSAHKNNTCQALIYHMYNIKCNSKYLRYDDGKFIVQSVIMSLIHVDYCNSLSYTAKYRL